MFSSYVLYDTVAIEAVYFPRHDLLPRERYTTTITQTEDRHAEHTRSSSSAAADPDAPYVLTLRDILLHRLTERYVGRVIPARGLCVAITEVMAYSASSVRGAAASAWLTATFGVCVLAPTRGTRLKATISHQTAAGVFLTLELFVAVPFLVPAHLLVPGSRFSPQLRCWYLPMDTEEEGKEEEEHAGLPDNAGAASSSCAGVDGASAAITIPHNKYLVGAEVLVKTEGCIVRSEEAVPSSKEGGEEVDNVHNNGGGCSGGSVRGFDGAVPNMELRGSFVGDALGPVSWFEDA